jgi:hypothetical protein
MIGNIVGGTFNRILTFLDHNLGNRGNSTPADSPKLHNDSIGVFLIFEP